jgi:hypothetical protein
MKTRQLTALGLLAAALSMQIAQAQPEEQQKIIDTPADNTPVPVPMMPPTVQGTKTYTQLPQPPDMPYVPTFTGAGKKFYRARKMVDSKTGMIGLETIWNVKEDQSTVIDWYKTALKQMQWKMENMEVADNGVMAERPKEGYRCVIMANESPDPSCKTQLVVAMTITKPVEDDTPSNFQKYKNGPTTNSKPAQPRFPFLPH